ncbi:hypothetical protein KIH39_05505 [Telmatocola sphagniphila]|uniref:Uncharacterized protein n=1 Tax=Telmatocola sphagniphila TaxID=1123043 RepID=A0A8E6EVX9_9BACT|nr:hypothetical protein [Telmatocola sphagniphila]QVL33370.1 hypothetical protein KIH39_05505 [Telmatocola sphagniphila]
MRYLAYLMILLGLSLSNGCSSCCKKKSCDSLPPVPRGSSGNPNYIPPANISPERSYYSPNEVILPDNQRAPARVEEKSRSQSSPLPPKQESIANKLPATDMPLGIPDFTSIKEGIWTGQRPDFDGLDWLKRKNVQQVVFLRTSADDELADRQQVEKRGIAFESLVVQADTLNEDLYRKFEKLVKGPKPVFVYDRTGAQKGYLWYIYFRSSELLPADVAKIRAERLGYADSGALGNAEMAAAAQKVIDTTK